jgi:peptide deformylase
MIYPIVAYGSPLLKLKAANIDKDFPKLNQLISDMYETMYHANGVGLAAPQIGFSIRLFVVDATPFAEDEPQLQGFKKVFINPKVVAEAGNEWSFNEGCLSIPGIREDISRKPGVELEYEDENFVKHKERFSGVAARIIQHEYDHLEGILFVDKVSSLKKKLLAGKLKDISNGKVNADYRMRFGVKA